jgi:hypothetical protein
MKLRDRVENNPAIFFAGAVVSGFLAGVGLYAGGLKVMNYEAVSSSYLEDLKQKAAEPKVAPIVQRWLHINGVSGLEGYAARLNIDVNGLLLSFPNNATYSRSWSNEHFQDFPLDQKVTSFTVRFEVIGQDAAGRPFRLATATGEVPISAPAAKTYRLNPYVTGSGTLTRAPLTRGLVKGGFPDAGPSQVMVNFSID